MLIKASLRGLREGHWYEYLIRFGLGGAATVCAALISRSFGPSVGGLFLAMPAIFCASATLIESHEQRQKAAIGLRGNRRGKQAAALDAAGAALVSLGLLALAAIFYALIRSSVVTAFVCASAGWGLVSVSAWWLHRRTRLTRLSG